MRDRISKRIFPILVLLPLVVQTAHAQQPFLLVRTPVAGTNERPTVSYDVGYGERTFGPIGNDGLHQAAMVRWRLGSRFAVVGGARMELTGKEASHGLTGDAEVEWSVRGGALVRTPVALGFGVRREIGPITVLTTRLSAARTFSRSVVGANILLERPVNGDRDAFDVITSAGFSRLVSHNVRLGVEAIGQDLEGFWEEDEAEGGAALFVGPSMMVTPARGRWSLAFGAGPSFHVTQSSRSSGAPRDVPNDGRTGYVVRTSFRYHPGR